MVPNILVLYLLYFLYFNSQFTRFNFTISFATTLNLLLFFVWALVYLLV
jgi:hypothetical protein